MRKSMFKILALSIFCLLVFSSVSPAQNEDENNRRAVSAASSIYVISAKAGGVNYTEGKVAVSRKDGKGGYLLKGDNLEVGDKVSTSADGKAEILLNPGSFVRLGENTDFEFVTTSLEDLKLKITRGSAMFEVIADNDFSVAVAAPKADFVLIKSGIYRVDVAADGSAVIEVWKGIAQIGDDESNILKKGQTASVNGSSVTVEKFDRDEKDGLEIWSKNRSKELAKMNSALERRSLRNSLISSAHSWSIYNSFGVWVFNSYLGSYCFLPFGYGWRSPYGYWFNHDIWTVRVPTIIIYSPPPAGPTPSRSKSPVTPIPSGNGAAQTSAPAGGGRETPVIRPPFTRIQRDVGAGFPSAPIPPIDMGPSRMPSIPMPAPVSAPSSVPSVSPGRRGN